MFRKKNPSMERDRNRGETRGKEVEGKRDRDRNRKKIDRLTHIHRKRERERQKEWRKKENVINLLVERGRPSRIQAVHLFCMLLLACRASKWEKKHFRVESKTRKDACSSCDHHPKNKY